LDIKACSRSLEAFADCAGDIIWPLLAKLDRFGADVAARAIVNDPVDGRWPALRLNAADYFRRLEQKRVIENVTVLKGAFIGRPVRKPLCDVVDICIGILEFHQALELMCGRVYAESPERTRQWRN